VGRDLCPRDSVAAPFGQLSFLDTQAPQKAREQLASGDDFTRSRAAGRGVAHSVAGADRQKVLARPKNGTYPVHLTCHELMGVASQFTHRIQYGKMDRLYGL